jgi:hypothetical protein
MASKKHDAPTRIIELFATSETRVERARKAFDAARTTMTNARTYGTATHAAAASQALIEAAEIYAGVMQTHAHVVMDYAAMMSEGSKP